MPCQQLTPAAPAPIALSTPAAPAATALTDPVAPAVDAVSEPAAPNVSAGSCGLVAPDRRVANAFPNEEQTEEAACGTGLRGDPASGTVAARTIWHPDGVESANLVAVELAQGRAAAALNCSYPQLADGVRRVDLTYHAVDHGIKAIAEYPDDGEFEIHFNGLVDLDTYEFDVEFDDGTIETYHLTADGTTGIFIEAYPAGATSIVRVEFMIYELPVVLTERAYRGYGARTDATEFYDVLEALVP